MIKLQVITINVINAYLGRYTIKDKMYPQETAIKTRSLIIKRVLSNISDRFLEEPGKHKRCIIQLRKVKNGLISLKEGVKETIKKEDKFLRDKIKRKITYKWTIADLRLSCTNLSKAEKIINKILEKIEKLLEKDDTISIKGREKIIELGENLRKSVNLSMVCLGAAGKKLEMEKVHERIAEKGLGEYLIRKEDLKKGDVLLSYKTKRYLKKNFLSYLITIACKSRITHSSVVQRKNKMMCKRINAAASKKRFGVIEISHEPGEILLVLRPKIPKKSKIMLDKVIDKWNDRMIKNKKYDFSERKCWAACLSGLIYSEGIVLLKRNIILGNLLKKNKGLFCSELVDSIFKEAGIYLAPRSGEDCLTGPSEMIYSPYLKFIGILANKKDRISEKELVI